MNSLLWGAFPGRRTWKGGLVRLGISGRRPHAATSQAQAFSTYMLHHVVGRAAQILQAFFGGHAGPTEMLPQDREKPRIARVRRLDVCGDGIVYGPAHGRRRELVEGVADQGVGEDVLQGGQAVGGGFALVG